MALPYSDPHRVAAGSSSHRDRPLQFASNDGQMSFADYVHSPWFGNAPPNATSYQNRPSSSSSLAGALDEEASQRPRHLTNHPSFPDSEVAPFVAPLLAFAPQDGIEPPAYLYPSYGQYTTSEACRSRSATRRCIDVLNHVSLYFQGVTTRWTAPMCTCPCSHSRTPPTAQCLTSRKTSLGTSKASSCRQAFPVNSFTQFVLPFSFASHALTQHDIDRFFTST